MMRKFPHRYHRVLGFSFPEVAVTSFLIIFLAVMSLDICLLIFGCSVNDKACRDVVRAAAQQPNASQALAFAIASTHNHQTDGIFISPITLVNGVNYNDFSGNVPAGETPYVQVTTQVLVTLPAPLYFFGDSFTNQITFKQTYTSPIVKTKFILP